MGSRIRKLIFENYSIGSMYKIYHARFNSNNSLIAPFEAHWELPSNYFPT